MSFSIHGTPHLLASFSLLIATISIIIKPTGRQTFLEDVKFSILFFSPFRSPRIVLSLVIYLIHLRLLNIADIQSSLKFLSHLEFPSRSSDLNRVWPQFARRLLLVGGTLPLYAVLLASTTCRWLHIFVTFLVAESVLVELLWFSRDSSPDGFIVRRGWPGRTMLLVKPLASPDILSSDHANNEGSTNETEGEKEDGHDSPPSAQKDNLCDRIQQLWPKATDPVIDFTVSALPPKYAPRLERIFSSNIRASQWTCGHWRCFVYVISRVVLRTTSFAWYIEQAFITWLLYDVLRPVTLQVSDTLLKINIVGDLLQHVYQISRLLALSASAHLFTKLIIILLRRQQRIRRASQDLAEFAPITSKGIQILVQVVMPNILFLLLVPGATSSNPPLTRQILSYATETIVIVVIWITGYRILLSSPNVSTLDSGSSLELNAAPRNDSSDTRNLAASASRLTLFNDKQGVSRGGSENPRIPAGSRFQIFRLAISIPILIVWGFLHY